MLTDVLDGTLSASDQTTFDLHVAGCPSCTSMLADARRGAAWLEMLKPHRPEPSADLLNRIFTQTIGVTAAPTSAFESARQTTPLNVPAPTPAFNPAAATPVLDSAKLPFRQRLANAFRLESLRHTLMQPRLAMTAAMAFFSIALTLNLTGVHLSDLRASDFKPSSIKRTFYETNARVVRTFDNMRVVYELESRVRALQSNAQNENPVPPAPAQNNQAPASQPSSDQQPNGQKNQENPDNKKPAPRPKSGTSRRESPEGRLEYVGSLSSGHGIPPAAASQDFVSYSLSVIRREQQGELA
jgi:hypothetical protein